MKIFPNTIMTANIYYGVQDARAIQTHATREEATERCDREADRGGDWIVLIAGEVVERRALAYSPNQGPRAAGTPGNVSGHAEDLSGPSEQEIARAKDPGECALGRYFARFPGCAVAVPS